MRYAFSLVELSIVLVILGLLTGGILAGQSLIRAAELRAVSSEYNKYIGSVQVFRDKYFALPGDMTNATKFWGKDATYCNAATEAANATTGTCNGDGNGQINSTSIYGSTFPRTAEMTETWRQMANAGLIEGTYNGVVTSNTNMDIGLNSPRSRMNQAGWTLYYRGLLGGSINYTVDYGNVMVFGTEVSTFHTYGATMTPAEAWNLDTKMDDGKPAYGRIIAIYWNDACATPDDGTTFTNTNLASSYKLNNTDVACALNFRTQL